MSDRIPPHNSQSESAVLGCCMYDMDGALAASRLLQPNDFYHTANRKIFDAIVALTMAGVQPDSILVADALGEELGAVGGHQYIHLVASSVPSSVNIERYADVVKGHSQRRQLLALSFEIQRSAYDGCVDAMRERLVAGVNSLDGAQSEIKHISDIEETDEGDRFKTGLECIDAMTGGLRAGVTLVSGKAGAGKTTLFLQLILRAARQGHPSMVLGADQMPSDQKQIMLSNLSGVPIEEFKRKDISVHREALSKLPILYYDGRFSLQTVCSVIRLYSARGTKFFLVDSLQMIAVNGKDETHEKTTEAARELKRVAHECKVFVLLTSEKTKQQGLAATMDNIRGGGGVSHTGDQIWWMEPQEPETRFAPTRPVKVTVFKNRLGVADEHETLTYAGSIHRFTDEGSVPFGAKKPIGGQFGG